LNFFVNLEEVPLLLNQSLFLVEHAVELPLVDLNRVLHLLVLQLKMIKLSTAPVLSVLEFILSRLQGTQLGSS